MPSRALQWVSFKFINNVCHPDGPLQSTVALIMNRDLIACVHMYLSAQRKASICHPEATDNDILWNLDLHCISLKEKNSSLW